MPGLQSIEGLASNLNITEIVDTVMSYERVPVTYLENDRDYKTQQVAAYKAVQAKFMGLKGQVRLLQKEAAYFKGKLRVSDESVLSVTTNGKVIEGSYDLSVQSMAKNHQIASQGFSDVTSENFGTGTIQLNLGSASKSIITIDEGQNSLIGIKDAINDAGIGISASIINDGSSSNPYRLLLSGSKTGAVNAIEFEMNLTGGENLNFENSTFDTPELLSFASGSSSAVNLGASASFSGSTNKIYSFTVDGNGEQTIGTDTITINWSDGANSGAILVTQADTEVELFGDGADGLKLSFGSGKLTGGDTFQVSTFAPILQGASDATVSIGSYENGGSPILINSETNTFTEVLPSLSFTVQKVTDPGESININAKIDTIEIKNMIDDLVSKYNDVMEFIDEQFNYNPDTTESGVLFTEYPLQAMQSSMRRSTTSIIPGLEKDINSLASIGIRTGADGKMTLTRSSDLTGAINDDLDNFIKLFTDSGSSSSNYIQFLDASEDTLESSAYDVNITQAATKGYFQGKSITAPSVSGVILTETNNIMKLKVDGLVSDEITLTRRSYESGEDLANEIQTRIDSDSKIGTRGISVEWVELGGDTGYIKFVSGSYGSKSKVELVTSISNSSYTALGLAGGTIFNGNDVAGTINGEKATGSGQKLSGDEDNPNTAGLKLKVTLTSAQLNGDAVDATISYVRGLASNMDKTLDSITRSIDGSIDRRVSSINVQIEELNEQITDYEAKLARRREDLYTEFLRMEESLGQLQSEGDYLTQQLDALNSNWQHLNNSGGN